MTTLLPDVARRLKQLEARVGRFATSSVDVSLAEYARTEWVVAQLALAAASVTAQLAAALSPQAWTGFTFLNSWANYGGGNQTGAYFQDAFGVVHLRGLVKRTVTGFGAGVPICTLPAGYRPAATISFWVWGGTTPKGTKVVLLTSGNVYVEASDSAAPEAILSLDGITFDTRA